MDAPVEFEKEPVGVQGFKKTTHHYRGVYRIYLKLVRKTESCQCVTGWTWKHLYIHHYCPKSLPEHYYKATNEISWTHHICIQVFPHG